MSSASSAALLEARTRQRRSGDRPSTALASIADDHVTPAATDRPKTRCKAPADARVAAAVASATGTVGHRRRRERRPVPERLPAHRWSPWSATCKARPTILAARQGDPLEIDMALGLFEPMRIGPPDRTVPALELSLLGPQGLHGAVSVLRASTEFEGRGRRPMREFMDLVSAYDVGDSARRRRIPASGLLDAGLPRCRGCGLDGQPRGSGLRRRPHFTGIVGTDILLSYLGDVLQSHHRPPGRAWIVDAADAVLADTDGLLPPEGEVPALADRLPPGLASDAFDPSVGYTAPGRRIRGLEFRDRRRTLASAGRGRRRRTAWARVRTALALRDPAGRARC